MNILEQYYLTLSKEAEKQKESAAAEAEKGDQRAQSICLMKASMLGDMLKVLGRVELEGKRPNALETLIDSFSKEADTLYRRGDYDGADRAEQKSITVQFALDALHEAENHGA